MTREHTALPTDGACLDAAAQFTPPMPAYLASLGLPDELDLLSAWRGLSPAVQDRIGTLAVAIAFYGLVAGDAYRPADRLLPDFIAQDAAGRHADAALTVVHAAVAEELPALFGTADDTPAWAANLAQHPRTMLQAIETHRQAWAAYRSSGELLDMLDQPERIQVVWPAQDAEADAFYALLDVPCAGREDAVALCRHWHSHVVASGDREQPRRPISVGMMRARVATLRALLAGSRLPGRVPAQLRAAIKAHRLAVEKVRGSALDDGRDLDALDASRAGLRVLLDMAVTNRAGAKALLAHLRMFAAGLTEAEDDDLGGYAGTVRARLADLELFAEPDADTLDAPAPRAVPSRQTFAAHAAAGAAR